MSLYSLIQSDLHAKAQWLYGSASFRNLVKARLEGAESPHRGRCVHWRRGENPGHGQPRQRRQSRRQRRRAGRCPRRRHRRGNSGQGREEIGIFTFVEFHAKIKVLFRR